ncbi:MULTISPECIES: hypothetical protein [Methylobacter]
MVRLIFIALSGFLFSSSVFADTYPAVNTYYYGAFGSGVDYRKPTQDAACEQARAVYAGASYVLNMSVSPNCKILNSGGGVVSSSSIASFPTCPGGGTVSGSSCINATPCTAPQVRGVTGMCATPPVVCSATEYDNGGVCAPIPDCNASSATGGNFFNKGTKQCETVSSPTICISDVNKKYCPPIDDCKPAAYICSNDSHTVTDANAQRSMEILATKALADAKKTQADQLAAAAADAAAVKAGSVDTAKAAKDAASIALAAAKASGDQVAIAAAVKEFAKANDAVIDALARASNSAGAKKKAEDLGTQIGGERDAIPSSNPGNAKAHDKNIDDLLPGVTRALDDAVSGDGNGTGRGSGVGTSSSSPSADTSGLATDATAQRIADNTKGTADSAKGILDKLNAADSFSSGGNTHGNGKSDGKTAISSVLCNGNCASSPSCTSGTCSPSERIDRLKGLYSLNASASGECPPIEMDLSGVGLGSHSVSGHCSLMESVRSSVSVIMTIVMAIGFIFILMSA